MLGSLEVFDDGRIELNGKPLKARKNSQGYLRVSVHKNGQRKRYFCHRLVAKAFIPNPLDKPEVNHKDGNPLNNNLSNLEWVTSSENKLHAYRTGLRKPSPNYGEDCGTSKLKEEDVLHIRSVAKESGRYYGRKKLAKKYGVSENAIKYVVNGRTWNHI